MKGQLHKVGVSGLKMLPCSSLATRGSQKGGFPDMTDL